MRRTRLAPLVAGLAAASLVLVGTASAQSPSASGAGGAAPGADLKIGLVTDVGTIDDRSFNQYSFEGAVLGAHVGPGMLAVCVAPRLTDPD